MDNYRLAEVLTSIAELHHLMDKNPFRARAYKKAATILKAFPEDIVSAEQLENVPGIGSSIKGRVDEILTTRKSSYLQSLRSSLPEDVARFINIPGLGVDKVKILMAEGITSLDDLEEAAVDGRLQNIKGFGDKLLAAVIDGVPRIRFYARMSLLPDAVAAADKVLEQLKWKAALTGEMRRNLEVVTEATLLVDCDLELCREHLAGKFPEAEFEILGDYLEMGVVDLDFKDKTRCINIYTAEKSDWGRELFLSTGSPEFIQAFRARFPTILDHPYENEEDIFNAAALPYIPPELRERAKGLEHIATGGLKKLVTEGDIRGVFHIHTNRSDGLEPLPAILNKAAAMGYKYIGIADHSQLAFYANGLSVEKLLEQGQEIELLRSHFPSLRIFWGVESDIRRDGSLDYPADVLAKLDYVIASIHSRYGMDGPEMTKRIVRAMENEYTTFWGHPVGRLLLKREPYHIDMEMIIDAAAANGKGIEINANPERLDLDWRYHQYAREKDVALFINTDAHNLEAFRFMKNGVQAARKGGLVPEDIVNAWPLPQVERYLGV